MELFWHFNREIFIHMVRIIEALIFDVVFLLFSNIFMSKKGVRQSNHVINFIIFK